MLQFGPIAATMALYPPVSLHNRCMSQFEWERSYVMRDGHLFLATMAEETVIRVLERADSSVNLICRPWVKTEDYWTVHGELTRAVKERFDAEGLSIPFPQRDVHLHTVTRQEPE